VLALFRHDVRLQYRHGLHAAYAFVSIAYIGMYYVLGSTIGNLLLPVVLFSEASVIGFIFAGTLFHFEKADGAHRALAVTPVRTSACLIARASALSLLTVLACFVIVAGTVRTSFHPLQLLLAAGLTSFLFACIGTAMASRFASIDRFAVWGGLLSAVFGLPLLPWFGVLESPLWALFPTGPSLALFGHALAMDAPVHSASAAIFIVVWTVPAFLLSRAWLDRFAFERRGSR
jgi:fluoroquinolone transport system permease protein